MFSIKAAVASVVEQARRVILQATRSRVNPPGHNKHLKLSEVQHQTGVVRPRPKGVISNQHCTETQGASSGSLISSSRGIVNLLRPVTSRIVQGLARRVSSPLWTEARKKSAKRLFGETAPYFALVGVSLVSGPERGLLTAQDELEAICGDIREAISRAGWIHNPDFWKQPRPDSCSEGDTITSREFSLSDFELGSAINKGCNAVVYAARWKNDDSVEADIKSESSNSVASKIVDGPPKLSESVQDIFASGSLWSLEQIQSNSRAVPQNRNFSTHADTPSKTFPCNPEEKCFGGDIDDFSSADTSSTEDTLSFDSNTQSPNYNASIGAIANSAEKVFNLGENYSLASLNDTPSTSKWGLCLRSKNSVSLSDVNLLLSTGGFQKRNGESSRKRKKVKFKDTGGIYGSDTDEEHLHPTEGGSGMKQQQHTGVSSSLEAYPLAMKMMFNYEAESNAPAILTAMYKEMLPAKAVQLDDVSSVWKQRYDCTLAEYLSQQKPNVRTSLLLLTQLLEAINHVNKYSITHRDLKSDNLLLSLEEGMESPHLVLSDFGCCLPDPGFHVAFSSYEADPRVGNAALMAPEIKSATPGLLTWLNYSKADLWSVGTLAYEIFGLENPFAPRCYGNTPRSSDSSRKVVMLDSATYKECQLPRLPKVIPAEIRFLIQDLLKRNPKQRPSPTVTATICQLSLWGPRKWLTRHALTMPSNNEVMSWLLCLSTKVICEAGSSSSSASRGGGPENVGAEKKAGDYVQEKTGGQLEYEIVSTFLKRVHYNDIIQAIKWIRAF